MSQSAVEQTYVKSAIVVKKKVLLSSDVRDARINFTAANAARNPIGKSTAMIALCSLSPGEQVTSSSILTCDELADEVTRITRLLKDWKAALDRDENVDTKALKDFKESKDLLNWEAQVPTSLQFSRDPPLHDQKTFRKPTILMARILLNYTIGNVLSADEKTALGKAIDLMILPSSFPQLYAPKVLSRPADLSPGEYEMLLTVFPMWTMADTTITASMSEDLKGAWLHLCVVQKKLWNA
ncbi:hypothetical protein BT96DRAFT_971424 [Gymnopus androsaceus JB14]|uniref:Uncharacterized protein n=1 Tax=Gymnopus androsaceus JB14 TaxID=1447944 RepID=A0A6A4ID44_9AGAR|nr:hypothetical protein BT96DRAFT_971424 [Gymnopus androsaceus JB14]